MDDNVVHEQDSRQAAMQGVEPVSGNRPSDRAGRSSRNRRRTAMIVLIISGIAIMAFCCPMAAYYSRQASASWFSEQGRRVAAYGAAVRAAETSTGKERSEMTPDELATLDRAADKDVWAAAYDPKRSTTDQGAANTIGLFGIFGFFLTVGAALGLMLKRSQVPGSVVPCADHES